MFFVVLFVVMLAQAYWVCEITYPGWKQIPGSVCVFPRSVPITLVVSKFPPSLAPPPHLFTGFVLSDGHLGYNLDRFTPDGMANFPAFPIDLGYPSSVNLDR